MKHRSLVVANTFIFAAFKTKKPYYKNVHYKNIFGSKAVFYMKPSKQFKPFKRLNKTLYFAPPDCSGFAFIECFYPI